MPGGLILLLGLASLPATKNTGEHDSRPKRCQRFDTLLCLPVTDFERGYEQACRGVTMHCTPCSICLEQL